MLWYSSVRLSSGGLTGNNTTQELLIRIFYILDKKFIGAYLRTGDTAQQPIKYAPTDPITYLHSWSIPGVVVQDKAFK